VNISSASRSKFHDVHFWKVVRTSGVFFIQLLYRVFGFKRESSELLGRIKDQIKQLNPAEAQLVLDRLLAENPMLRTVLGAQSETQTSFRNLVNPEGITPEEVLRRETL